MEKEFFCRRAAVYSPPWVKQGFKSSNISFQNQLWWKGWKKQNFVLKQTSCQLAEARWPNQRVRLYIWNIAESCLSLFSLCLCVVACFSYKIRQVSWKDWWPQHFHLNVLFSLPSVQFVTGNSKRTKCCYKTSSESWNLKVDAACSVPLKPILQLILFLLSSTSSTFQKIH